jgi:hypothetical protein
MRVEIFGGNVRTGGGLRGWLLAFSFTVGLLLRGTRRLETATTRHHRSGRGWRRAGSAFLAEHEPLEVSRRRCAELLAADEAP